MLPCAPTTDHEAGARCPLVEVLIHNTKGTNWSICDRQLSRSKPGGLLIGGPAQPDSWQRRRGVIFCRSLLGAKSVIR